MMQYIREPLMVDINNKDHIFIQYIPRCYRCNAVSYDDRKYPFITLGAHGIETIKINTCDKCHQLILNNVQMPIEGSLKWINAAKKHIDKYLHIYE